MPKEKLKQYFEQQREQFGETIYLDKKTDFTPDTNVDPKKNIESSLQKPEAEKFIQLNVNEKWNKCTTLDQLYENIHNCQKCILGETRSKFVFGTGNPNADIMIIGEAPGRDEDIKGEPFVGRAGQLLTKIIEAIDLKREDVFIANIIKCRPPSNRRPLPDEVEHCEPYLQKQIELIKPVFIIALGLTAIDTLFKKKHKMGEMRGKILDYQGIQLLVTYHPAALLRNPNWKKPVWEDVKLLRRMYDEYLAKK